MYRIFTGDKDLAREGVGDVSRYVAEQVSGRRDDPLAGVINSVACWGDSRADDHDPGRAAVAADGTRATPDARRQRATLGTVCPTDPEYRVGLLDCIDEVGDVGDVRLTTDSFPSESASRESDRERSLAARTTTSTICSSDTPGES